MIPVRQSTAFECSVGPVLDADGAAVTDCVVGDFKIKKTTGNYAALNGSATLTHVSAGTYDLVLTTSDTDTVGLATISIDDTVNACAPVRLQVMEEAIYDAIYAASANAWSGAAGSTTLTALAAGSITASVVATGAIDADAIADNAIDAGAIASDAITAAKIASDAITAAKIATGAITSAKFAAGAIDAAAIAADAIGASELAADAASEIATAVTTALGTGSGLTTLATAAELAKVPKSDSNVTWNATALASIQTKANDAIVANNLDHLVLSAVDTNFATTVHVDSVIGQLAQTADAGYDRSTDSLEAARDNIGTAGAGLTAADDAMMTAIADVPTVAEFEARTPSSTAASNMTIVFATDFATNYNTTNDRWAVNVEAWRATDLSGPNYNSVAYGRLPIVNIVAVSNDEEAADTLELFAEALDQSTGQLDSGSLASGTITAASIASDAITDAKVASDVTIASVTGAVGSVTGNVGGNVTGSVGSVTNLTIQSSTILATGTHNPQTGDAYARLGAPAGASVSADIAAVAADHPNRPARGVEFANMMFLMVDATDLNSPETGITVTATISKDGGAFASCSNSVSEVSGGWYKITLTASEMTADSIAVKFTGTGCAQRNIAFRTQPT